MRVGIFKSVKAAKLQETELDRIVYMMQFSHVICARTQIYRQYLEWNDMKKGKKNITRKLKNMKTTRFPAFTPCATFYDGKSRENVVGLTDLCYLDFDHIKEGQIREAMKNLSDDPYVVMASRSLSNEGLHVLIRYNLRDMTQPPQRTEMTPNEMQDIYAKIYSHLAAAYQQKLGLESDLQAGHMEHMYIVSYDPELYYNPNAESLMIDLNATTTMDAQSIIGHIKARMQEAVNLVSKNRLYDTEKILQEVRKRIIEYSSSFDEEAKQEVSHLIPKVDEFLENIKTTRETIKKVYNTMNEVDKDLKCHNTKIALEKIVECQHILKGITGLCKQQYVLNKVRQRVLENEMKLGALNREIRQKERERKVKECNYIIREKEEYRQAVLYLINKYESLQMEFEQGNLDNCEDILAVISNCLDELPEDLNKNLLQAKYEEYMKLILKETT